MREPNDSPSGRPAEPDRRLRTALEPPPGAAERIARRALAEEGRERSSRLRPVFAVAGLALAAVALAALLALPGLRSGERPREGAGAPAAGAARYSITNRGEVLIVQALDGGPSLLSSAAGGRPSSPGKKIIVSGGNRP